MEQHQLISLLITAILVVGWVIWRNRPAKNAPRTSGDAAVIANLAEIGSNLSVPHLIEFFFYFPTEEGASQIAKTLTQDGFKVQAQRQLDEGEWSLVVTKRMLPEVEELESLRAEFELLVEPVQGEYDGFGTEIES